MISFRAALAARGLVLASLLTAPLACSQSSDAGPPCVGAKCDGLGSGGEPAPKASCYPSRTTGAIRCDEAGLPGLANLIKDGFDPVAPIQCEDVSVGDAGDPSKQAAVAAIVIPVCRALPYCTFREGAGACEPRWRLTGTEAPSVQCGLIDAAPISDAAKEAYCGLGACVGVGCDAPCQAVKDARSGATRCIAKGGKALADLIDSGVQPVVAQTCGEINALVPELEPTLGNDQAELAMRAVCDATPHCLFKESGGFCMPAWQIVDSITPDVQCKLIDGDRATEAAREAYCSLLVEAACDGADCKACTWKPGEVGGGTCAAAAP